MASDPKIVQYVEELDLLIIRDGEKLYHIDGNVIAGMFKAYMEGRGIDYDICEGCERKREDNTESPACESCQNQNTCKDAPIPSRYDCLGYKPEAGSMRLIDADALVKELSGKYIIVPADEAARGVADFMSMQMRQAINNAPTIEAVPLEDYRSMEQTVHKLTQAIAEAEPVKHGRWIREPNCWYRCSVCGGHYPSIQDNMTYRYCPSCGAKNIPTEYTNIPTEYTNCGARVDFGEVEE